MMTQPCIVACLCAPAPSASACHSVPPGLPGPGVFAVAAGSAGLPALSPWPKGRQDRHVSANCGSHPGQQAAGGRVLPASPGKLWWPGCMMQQCLEGLLHRQLQVKAARDDLHHWVCSHTEQGLNGCTRRHKRGCTSCCSVADLEQVAAAARHSCCANLLH